jgi:DNA-binding transcriptional MerR regulator
MDVHYPIGAVAKLTGLSIDTLRAWERRYRAVVPERSDRGRAYTQTHIEKLILLRELVERGHAIGQVAALQEPALRELLSTRPQTDRRPPVDSKELVESLLDAFCNFEHTRANQELGRLAALLTPRDLVYQVVLPLMQAVGERWHRGEMGIAPEHLVSTALRNLFGSLLRLFTIPPGAPKILIATLSGELHEFGILASAMLAAISGLDPILLGPNVPAKELVGAAEKTKAEVVLIGFSGPVESACVDLDKLIGSLPSGTQIWIGGSSIPEVTKSDPANPVVVFTEMEEFENQCRRRRGVARL